MEYWDKLWEIMEIVRRVKGNSVGPYVVSVPLRGRKDSQM